MKKYINLILITFLLIIGSVNYVMAKNNALKNKIIVIDAGHGNKDPGSVVGDLYEKDINLQIALLLRSELRKYGAKVIMTRDGDYDLAYPGSSFRKKSDFDNRIKIINNSGADMYLSIHLNYLADSSYYGPQVFYDKENKKLAEIIQQSLNKEIKNDREIKKIPSSTYMYDKLNISGVLIECGFLSNTNERKLLVTEKHQEKLVKAIIKGLLVYFT